MEGGEDFVSTGQGIGFREDTFSLFRSGVFGTCNGGM
jgi:hypothetical protein